MYIFLLFISLSALFTSCQSTSFTQKIGAEHGAKVVVSIYPYKKIVERIGGNSVTVTSLIPQGFDPHQEEINPKIIYDLGTPDLFIGVGEPFEKKAIDRLVSLQNHLSVLSITEHLSLRGVSGCGHGCHGTKDRHIWLSVVKWKEQIPFIVEALTKLQPEYALVYQKNGEDLTTELEILNGQFHLRLAPYIGRSLIVAHDCLGYFCEDYGLRQLPLEFEGKEVRPKYLPELYREALSSHPLCTVVMPQFSQKGVLQFGEPFQLKTVHFDPMAEDILHELAHLVEGIVE